MSGIAIYDTTLRDGSQSEEINLSTADKIRIARKLDDLGVEYIEGGWPGSNPTDLGFFKDIKNYELTHAKVTAFGSTHMTKASPESDKNLQALVSARAEVITIFGKTWDIHVEEALRTTLEHNLEIIHDSLAFLRPQVGELLFDAEHFFDGFKANQEFAMACLDRAIKAGADGLVLCDTNGGTLPGDIAKTVTLVRKTFPDTILGIHAHNDGELAVANSLQAVQSGATHIQGTINGYGERCGNANLCSIIPNLEIKMGIPCLPEGCLAKLANVSHVISEVANVRSFHRQPFVGKSAFAHKGGVHVSAVRKNPKTYEHIPPAMVGNKQRILLSDLAGQSNILFKAKRYGFDLDKNDPFVLELLSELKHRENNGYEFSAAEASFELLLNRVMGRSREYFKIIAFRVFDTQHRKDDAPFTEATVMVKVGGMIEHTAATGMGPVNALDNALRKALQRFYPNISNMHLVDFKVRVLWDLKNEDDQFAGTASQVRVLIESRDQYAQWVTVGVHYNILEASRQALEDSVNYKLFKDDQKKLTKAIRERDK
ncbi:citramalate synthase [Desulfoplanes sp.]